MKRGGGSKRELKNANRTLLNDTKIPAQDKAKTLESYALSA
jgi:hypothetical protein